MGEVDDLAAEKLEARIDVWLALARRPPRSLAAKAPRAWPAFPFILPAISSARPRSSAAWTPPNSTTRPSSPSSARSAPSSDTKSTGNGRRSAPSLAGLLHSRAVYDGPFGCRVLHPGREARFFQRRSGDSEPLVASPSSIAGPGIVAPANDKLSEALDHAFAESASGPRRFTKAVVVLHRGRVVGERYAPGVTPATPLIGWSMTKSVTNALLGILVRKGKLDMKAAGRHRRMVGACRPAPRHHRRPVAAHGERHRLRPVAARRDLPPCSMPTPKWSSTWPTNRPSRPMRACAQNPEPSGATPTAISFCCRG